MDGFATVAGRLNLNPQTGCPAAVLVTLDRDPSDKLLGYRDLSDKEDPDEVKDVLRAGHAHLIGVLDLVSAGSAEKVLVPLGHLSIRRGSARSRSERDPLGRISRRPVAILPPDGVRREEVRS